jgi:hypothetical protein
VCAQQGQWLPAASARVKDPEKRCYLQKDILNNLGNSSLPVVAIQMNRVEPLSLPSICLGHFDVHCLPRVACADVDIFTIASIGTFGHAELPDDQADVLKWTMNGRMDPRPRIAPSALGYGDDSLLSMVSKLIEATKATGAVRHSIEAYNWEFPEAVNPDDDMAILEHGSFKEVKGHALLQELHTLADVGWCVPVIPVIASKESSWAALFHKSVATGRWPLPKEVVLAVPRKRARRARGGA